MVWIDRPLGNKLHTHTCWFLLLIELHSHAKDALVLLKQAGVGHDPFCQEYCCLLVHALYVALGILGSVSSAPFPQCGEELSLGGWCVLA